MSFISNRDTHPTQFLGGLHRPQTNADIADPNKKGNIYEPLFNLNHENNHHISFFFTALYSAIILAIVVSVDGYLDELLMKRYKNNNHRRAIKLGIHVVTMFILSLALIYIFRMLWGPVYM